MTGHATYDFDGETAIVTGSTKGIGRGIAERLLETGANVTINARSASTVDETAAALDDRYEGAALGVAGDVGDPSAIEAVVDETIEAFGGVDLLVNNAAVWPDEPSMVEATLEEWDHAMAVNVRAQWYAAKLAAEHMIDADRPGAIVNVTSQTGDRRAGRRGLYGASKTAVNGLTWRMAHELADHGIRLNGVSTAATDSFQLRSGIERQAADSGRSFEALWDELNESMPLGRVGEPEDVADSVCFLASDRAEYVVGEILRVSGGGNLQ